MRISKLFIFKFFSIRLFYMLYFKEIFEIFRSYFDGIVDALNIKRCEISKEHSDPILNAIKTFEKHSSILKIKELNFGGRKSWRCQKSNSGAGYFESFPTPRHSN